MKLLLILVCILLVSVGGTLAANASVTTLIGTLPDDFVGYHTGLWPGSNESRVDCNGDAAEDCYSNYTEHQEALVEAGAKWITGDFNPEDNMLNSTTFKSVTSNFADIRNRQNQNWTRPLGIDVHYRIFGMPSWLANSSGCSTTRTCPPDNYTEWYETLDTLIQTVECDAYTDWCTLVFWNEEDLSNFFLSSISESNTTRETQFITFANNTLVWLNSTYPDIRVCLVTPSTFDDTTSRRQTSALIGNISPSLYDCLAPHEYQWNLYDPDYDTQIRDSINYLYDFCDANPQHSARCSGKPIYWGETHVRNQTWLTSEQNKAQSQLWLLASELAREYGQHRFAVYKWTEVANSTVDTSNPRFATYYEAQNNGGTAVKTSAFNVTRDLAQHSGSVYNFTTSDSDVALMVTENGSTRVVTVINRGSSTKTNFTVDSGVDGTLSSLSGHDFSLEGSIVSMDLAAYDVQTFSISASSSRALILNGKIAIVNGLVVFLS